jgi:hypothetical protein
MKHRKRLLVVRARFDPIRNRNELRMPPLIVGGRYTCIHTASNTILCLDRPPFAQEAICSSTPNLAVPNSTPLGRSASYAAGYWPLLVAMKKHLAMPCPAADPQTEISMTQAKKSNTAKGLSIEKMSTTCGRGRMTLRKSSSSLPNPVVSGHRLQVPKWEPF